MSKVMLRKTYNHIINNIDRVVVDLENGLVITARGTNGSIDKGYLKVKLGKKTVYVHQIISVAVYGEGCIGKQINHKDGNKLNNKPSNLEVCTQLENLIHQAKNGLMAKQPRKLSKEQIEFIIANDISSSILGDMFNVSHTTICNIRKGKIYKDILDEIKDTN